MRSGFFNSIDGDRKYDADDISNYFLKLISNGVFATPANSMQIQAATGMRVKVTPGWAFINCKWLRLDNDHYITLDKADVKYNRVDRIVLRLDPSDDVRAITIQVKKGDAKEKAYLKSLERVKNGVWELSLGYVWVHANATEIRQSNIVDERANTDVCGFVTGLIDQIDTTNLFAQYDDAFNEFMDKLHDGSAGVSGGNNDLIRTFTNFGQMLLGYTCYPIKEWDHFPGNLNGYGVATEQWDINNGEKLLVWWNGQLLMEGVDYMMSAGGYTDPFMHIVTFDRDKYVGGALTLQCWYHPDNVPKDPFEEEKEANAKKKAAAISGSAATDVSGKKTTTVSGSSASTASNAGVTTIHGKAAKEED